MDEHLLEEMQRRVHAQAEKVKRRKCIVEHPFGTIKHSMNQGYFLIRRLPSLRSEMSLTVLAYNTKRVLKILGVKNLAAALAWQLPFFFATPVTCSTQPLAIIFSSARETSHPALTSHTVWPVARRPSP